MASAMLRHGPRLSIHRLPLSSTLGASSTARTLSTSARTFAQVVSDSSLSSSQWDNKTAKELIAELTARGVPTPKGGRISRARALQLLLDDEASRRPPSSPAPIPNPTPTSAPVAPTTTSPLARPTQVQTRAASTTSTSGEGKDARVRGARSVPSTGSSTPADIVLPTPWEGEEPEGIKIPILPSYGPTRHVAPTSSSSEAAPAEETPHVPRVSTASLASTYAGSGPSHAHFPEGIPSELADHASSPPSKSQGTSIQVLLASLESFDFKTPESLKGLGGKVKDGLVQALGGVEEGKKEGEKKEEGKKEEKYEWEDRKLNEEERTGLYALAATLVGGWALGGLLMPTRGAETEKVNVGH